MELSQIKYFLAAAHTNNFTAAAQRLYVSQPTLSKAISALETELNVPLFDRVGKNVYLNNFGKAFESYAVHAVNSLEDAQRLVQDMSGDVSGPLSIAFSVPDASPSLFINCIEDFLTEYPKVSMSKCYLSTQEIIENLHIGTVDIGITEEIGPIPQISWWPLRSCRVGVCVSNTHPLAGRQSLSLSELRNEQFVDCGANLAQRNLTTLLCSKAGFVPNILFSGNANSLVEKLLFTRDVVMLSTQDRHFAPPAEVESFQSSEGCHKDTVYIPLSDPFCVHRVGIALKEGRYKTLALRRFVDMLFAEFKSTYGDPESLDPDSEKA